MSQSMMDLFQSMSIIFLGLALIYHITKGRHQ